MLCGRIVTAPLLLITGARTVTISRIVEVVLIAMVTTMSVFLAATFLGTCVPMNTVIDTTDCPAFVS